tara:strand:- start:172 stop:669 length:498 start_codon:yes stop_codon:yes gene_type:complete
VVNTFDTIDGIVGIAIGLGMVLSLFLTETLGITAGGLIVPGYIALHFDQPINIIITFLISILTVGIIKLLSNMMLIYGKRRLVLCLLLGFLFGYIFRQENNSEGMFSFIASYHTYYDIDVIGYIIPGLIASWMDRQGIVRTICTIMITASIVFLIMLLIFIDKVN